MNLPKEFAANMEKLFVNPKEAAAFFASLEDGRHYGLRVNTLKISVDDFLAKFNDIKPVPWCPTGFYYVGTTPASKNPLYNAGLYYIQEPSAMSAASILNVQPGDKVLDLCASPGGKSTQIAAALGGNGLLVANEVNQSRIPHLVWNIEIAGIDNGIILQEKPERLAKHFPAYFDKILVDAPCSGEGMFRKDPEAVLAWDKNKSSRLAVIQKDILHSAAKMLAVGGHMVYSTCTFSPIENENVIDDFLDNHNDFQLVHILHEKFGISPANQGLATTNNHAARIWPHRHQGEGHFVALLQRVGGSDEPFAKKELPTKKLDSTSSLYFNEFCQKHMPNRQFGRVFVHRGRLYAMPDISPDTNGLHVVRYGLYLGQLQKHRFTPSHALAMTLAKEEFAPAIDLAGDDPRISRYLGGETFEITAPDGYNIFCVEGFPIGFAKVLNGRLKGHIKGR